MTAAALLTFCCPASAFEIDGLHYDIDSTSSTPCAIVTGADAVLSHVAIPEQVTHEGATFSVASIGERAFEGHTAMTSVAIPNTITKIGRNAFYDCTGLNEVCIDDLAAWVRIDFGSDSGDNIYYDDFGEILIPYSRWSFLGTPETNPLYYAHHLAVGGETVSDLVIPDGITGISAFAFAGGDFTSVHLPASMKSIGYKAFWECDQLTQVHITDLAAWCHMDFGSKEYNCYYCYDDVNYPANLICDNKYTYREDNSNPLETAHHLYLNGAEIIDLAIPEGVTAIPHHAFAGCNALQSVMVPTTLKSIGHNAFSGCTALNRLIVPNIESWCRVGFIRYRPIFEGGPLPQSTYQVLVGDNPLEHAGHLFVGTTEVTDLVIPEGTNTIGYKSFSGGRFIKSVTLPSSLNEIGGEAFAECSGLTRIYSHIMNPDPWDFAINSSIGHDEKDPSYTVYTGSVPYGAVFDGVDKSTCVLYVPKGEAEEYRAANYLVRPYYESYYDAYYDFHDEEYATIWNEFEQIIEVDWATEDPTITTGDVTGNGTVDVDDLNLVVNMLLELYTPSNEADVNGDGSVDIEDVNAIINIILNQQ